MQPEALIFIIALIGAIFTPLLIFAMAREINQTKQLGTKDEF